MSPVFKSQVKGSDEINLSKVLDLLKTKWFYVVITLALGIVGSKLYLRYTAPVYVASGTVKVEDNNTGFKNLGFIDNLDNFTDNIQTEIQLLQSRMLIEKAVKKMDLDVSYFIEGTIKSTEIYNESPFRVIYTHGDDVQYGKMFSLAYLGGNKFNLEYERGQESITEQYYFGSPIKVGNFAFTIIKTDNDRFFTTERNYKWKANRAGNMVGRAKAGLKIDQSSFMVSILKISSSDHVPGFAADFVNALSEVYVDENKKNKAQAAEQTLRFLRNQLDSIQLSVDSSERAIELFKQNNELVNVETKVTEGMDRLRTLEEKKALLDLRLKSVIRLESQAMRKADTLSLPFTLDSDAAPLLSAMVSSYNSLVQDRIAALKIFTRNHPKIKELDSKQEELQASVIQSISYVKSGLQDELRFYEDKINNSHIDLKTIPSTQREYVSLLRKYEVREKIFSLLLEKQAEAQVAKESIVSSVQIIDRALKPTSPVSPNQKKVHLVGAGLGFTLGLSLVLLLGFLKNTITYREEIENLSLTPIIGVVRRSSMSLKHKYPRLSSIENPKSSLSESIRSIRTNLQFISSDKKNKVIAITSTVSGEGKSFITINLAGVISMLNRKIVIMDLDLRKPKLHYSFGLDNSKGISTFLVGKSELEEILSPSQYDKLDIITSGPIPPNPAELIQSFRMELLLMELKKKYDFILVDTPPIGLVTDGTTMLKLADITLYVIRADYSKKAYAGIPDQLVEDHKIKNLYIILNSVSQTTGRYSGYGYKVYSSGYYSDEVTPPRWYQFRKFFKKRRKK